MQQDLLTHRLLELLPQTQCTRCGFEDCEAYAKSIAHENTPINQCPPGGQEGIERLARLTQRDPLPLNPAFGVEGPRKMAFIDEQWCIGCTLCLDACPTDAIMGTHKSMHTVIESFCTGCELCVPVCPIDCIELEVATPEQTGWKAWSTDQASEAQKRYRAHKKRLDEKALKGPKTHTQAKRLHALSSSLQASPDNNKTMSQGKDEHLGGSALEHTNAPAQSGNEGLSNAPTTIDKAALVQKALEKAMEKSRLRGVDRKP